jgi:RNA recognition motif-containing protein
MAVEIPRHRLNKLFLGGLPDEVEEEEIRTHFSKYGQIIDLVIIRDKVTRQNRGFGFVTFKEAKAMREAFRIKQRLRDKTLDIKVAEPKKQSEKEMTVNVSQIKKIFIGGISKEVTPAIFREHFEKYGQISDIVLIQDRDTNAPRGFGFVTFHDCETVKRVMGDYSNHCLLGKWVDCKLALPRYNEEADSYGSKAPFQRDPYKGYPVGPESSYPYQRAMKFNGNSSGKIRSIKCPKKKKTKKRVNPSEKTMELPSKGHTLGENLATKLRGNYKFRLAPPFHLLSSSRFTSILERNSPTSEDTFCYLKMVNGQPRRIKTTVSLTSISWSSKKDSSPPAVALEAPGAKKEKTLGDLFLEEENSSGRETAKRLPFCLEACLNTLSPRLPLEEGEITAKHDHHAQHFFEGVGSSGIKQAGSVTKNELDSQLRRSKTDVCAGKSPMNGFTPKTATNSQSAFSPKAPSFSNPKTWTQERTLQGFSRINTQRIEERELDILEEASVSSLNDSIDKAIGDEIMHRNEHNLGGAMPTEPEMGRQAKPKGSLDQVQLQSFVLLPTKHIKGSTIESNHYH